MVALKGNDEPDIEPIHLLIRFSDKVGAIEDTIQAHREVILKHGAVWFGKMGKTLASYHVARMNAQCNRKVPTHIYLIQGGKAPCQIFRATVTEIARSAPTGGKELVPKYYAKNGLTKFIRLWGNVSAIQLMPEGYLSNLFVAKTGSRVSDILHSSMSGLFIVKERNVGSPVTYHFRKRSPG